MKLNNKRYLNYGWLVLGFSTGGFVSFLIIVLVTQEDLFDKPWDIVWAGLFGLCGSVIGGIIGGLAAYYVAKLQINSQADNENKKNQDAQRLTFTIVNEEMLINKIVVDDIVEIIPESKDERDSISRGMVSPAGATVREALALFIDDLNLDYLLQVRIGLTSSEYLSTHKAIQHLIIIQKIGMRILEFSNPDNISNGLKRIRDNAIQYINYFDGESGQ